MTDYKNTLNLPKTAFSMKANLPNREPKTLNAWYETKLYNKIRLQTKEKPIFILHDGPPYANGDIHLGHVLNKVLKDIIIKSKTLDGYNAPYLPGWDCHGLPIEHKVEKKIGKPGVKVDHKTFRQKCREYAKKQIDIQLKEFKRLGILGEWDNPYLTMNFKYEANIVRSLARIIKNNHLQRGYKPVYWSVVGQSALAEAEVEYREKKSSSIYVKYSTCDNSKILNIFNCDHKYKNHPISVAIWTTTPWTLPSSQAVTVSAEIEYSLVKCNFQETEQLLIAGSASISELMNKIGTSEYKILGTIGGESLENIKVEHPFYNKKLPVILGTHVTTESGTSCVHTAPDHGIDDFNIGKQYNLDTLNLIDDGGVFRENVEYFAGEHVYKVDPKIIERLKQNNKLLHTETIQHSYPHCWRTKTPLIFRATPQWFISMTQSNLLEKCQNALKDVQFTPDWGRQRMNGMLAGSPDWCISRQRTWGVPIAVFVHKETYELHPNTQNLMEQVAKIIEKDGMDAWHDLDITKILSPEDAQNYIKVTDTLDVWFDSGISHTAVVKHNGWQYPVDLYLEGSDQHRGWFQSSLKTGIAINNKAPYKNILTHGFIVDERGHKMSKSLGNGIEPKEIINELGADVIRLWVSSVDYSTDMSVSKETFKRVSEGYRRIRNTARFLLGNLNNFTPKTDIVKPEKLLLLDAWIVERAYNLQQEIVEAYRVYNFSLIYKKIHNFCVNDLGGFYLDVIKDRQYTTQEKSHERLSCQTAMYHISEAFVRWLAPILSFTADEIWSFLPGEREESVQMSTWYADLCESSNTKYDNAFWTKLLSIRECVKKALENARNEGVIGGTLEAEVTIYADNNLQKLFSEIEDELRFIFITSEAKIENIKNATFDATQTEINELKLKIKASTYKKCVRCWHQRSDIGENKEHADICGRCIENVYGQGEKRILG